MNANPTLKSISDRVAQIEKAFAARSNGSKEPAVYAARAIITETEPGPELTGGSAKPHTAFFEVVVETFREWGSIMTTTVTMTHLNPGAENDLVKKDGNYVIKVRMDNPHQPDGCSEVRIQFRVSRALFRFLGIAFSRRDKDTLNSVGQVNFPRTRTFSDEMFSYLEVTNTRKDRASYDYLILLQNVADGKIGVIDPEIVNED